MVCTPSEPRTKYTLCVRRLTQQAIESRDNGAIAYLEKQYRSEAARLYRERCGDDELAAPPHPGIVAVCCAWLVLGFIGVWASAVAAVDWLLP